MKMRTLGANGPQISVVGYGAWEIGGAWGTIPPDDQVAATMRAGFEAGINWIDSAEVYGGGRSEETCGKALEGFDDVLVFTKVAPGPNGSGFEPTSVRAACEKSLKRLGRDHIDVYQLHWPDAAIPVEDTWAAMASLVDDGLVRHIGVSNFDQALIERCEQIRHVDSLQPQFSMLTRQHADLIAWCGTNGTGVVAYAPLAYGLLGGKITMDTTFEDDDWRAGKTGMGGYARLFAPEARVKQLAIVEQLRPIADRLGIAPAQLALAWVFHQPGGTAAIAGSRRTEHVLTNAAAGDVTLDDEVLAQIGAILG